MDVVTTIADVRTFETRGGNQRYVVRDADGNEYTTFREAIGSSAAELEGERVRIEYHEEQRGNYTNVYLDKVEAAPEGSGDAQPDTDPEEADVSFAWAGAETSRESDMIVAANSFISVLSIEYGLPEFLKHRAHRAPPVARLVERGTSLIVAARASGLTMGVTKRAA